MANVRNINLNLLVAFDALMSERSVTRAAARMGLTQPAMSNVLAQLRTLFDDPLFVRVGRGMQPTPRAEALAGSVRRGIESFERALEAPQPFDPATSQARLCLAMSDHAELVLLPRLLQRIERDAPGLDLQVVPWGLHQIHPQLATGEVDVMISYYEAEQAPAGHHHEVLLTDVFVCMVRADHPRVGKRLSLRLFLSLGHIIVTERLGDRGAIDSALDQLGHKRRIAARVPSFFMVPHLVAGTDLIASIDSRVARYFSRWLPIRLLPPPAQVPFPEGRIGMLWHERSQADPARAWLRSIIREESAAI